MRFSLSFWPVKIIWERSCQEPVHCCLVEPFLVWVTQSQAVIELRCSLFGFGEINEAIITVLQIKFFVTEQRNKAAFSSREIYTVYSSIGYSVTVQLAKFILNFLLGLKIGGGYEEKRDRNINFLPMLIVKSPTYIRVCKHMCVYKYLPFSIIVYTELHLQT